MPTKIKGTTGVDKIEAGAVITNPSFSGNATVTGTLTVDSTASINGSNLPQQFGFRNLIINGDMNIAQRGTSATGLSNGSTGYHTVDRFQFVESGSPTSVWTMSQDTNVPSGQGFSNSLKMQCTTAQSSIGTGDSLYLFHKIEGQNLQHLKFGTSSAESITLSFWVKSNKTGTYIAELYQTDATRAVSYAYTISSADTWEKKTITYVGDTSGQIDNDNGTGLQIAFWLATGTDRSSGTLATSWATVNNPDRAVGQVNLGDSTSNYINITGVQLEVGSGASDFEFLPYDVQLARCQRYYEKSYNISQSAGTSTANGQEYFQVAGARSTNYGLYTTHYKVPKRASCTVTLYSQSGTSGYLSNGDSGANLGTGGVLFNGSENMFVSKNTGSTIADGTVIAYQWTAESEL
jgi:hypothetical protein